WDQETGDYGCAFPPVAVRIAVHHGLLERAPELVEFLRNYETELFHTNEALAYMELSGGDAFDAARWFLREYEDLWMQWVDADVAARVKAALDAGLYADTGTQFRSGDGTGGTGAWETRAGGTGPAKPVLRNRSCETGPAKPVLRNRSCETGAGETGAGETGAGETRVGGTETGRAGGSAARRSRSGNGRNDARVVREGCDRVGEVLRVNNLWKVFGRPKFRFDPDEPGALEKLEALGVVAAVRDVSLSLQRGEFFVVMGLSGSG